MQDSTTTLSPAAQAKLDTLIDEHGVDDSAKLLVVLQWLAARPLPPIEEVRVNGQGLDERERSEEDHEVAVELQKYAIAMIGSDISKSLTKLPQWTTLDEFLDNLMPNTGRGVRRQRFLDFLRHEATENADLFPCPARAELRAYHASPFACCDGIEQIEERIEQQIKQQIEEQAQRRFASLDLPPDAAPLVKPSAPLLPEFWPRINPPSPPDSLALYDIKKKYQAWWKRQEEGSGFAKGNAEKQMAVKERREAMIKLLPIRTNDCGIDRDEWLRRVRREENLFSSLRTFNRDVQEMINAKLVHVQDDGRIRQHRKKNAGT